MEETLRDAIRGKPQNLADLRNVQRVPDEQFNMKRWLQGAGPDHIIVDNTATLQAPNSDAPPKAPNKP